MSEQSEKLFYCIAFVMFIIVLGYAAVNEAEKVEKCNSLNGVMIEGKCLDIRVLK